LNRGLFIALSKLVPAEKPPSSFFHRPGPVGSIFPYVTG
jgi:hypothetical protein